MKKYLNILLLLAALLAGVYAWLGGFSTVKVSKEKAEAFHLLYLEHTGPYSKIYPVIQSVEKLMKEKNLEYESTFGIYYDNPRNVDKKKLRSIAGAVVSKDELKKAESLINAGKLKSRIIREQSYAKTEFPHKMFLSMFVAVCRVYPALNEYAKSENIPEMKYNEKDYEGNFVMELYKKGKIEYFMTLPKK